ncbi:DUF4386 domain-containing protein [Nocardia ninae]|uniref:DUF4386 domain-containing protein n=1 Tax=Nocardia ninae NBRC 108245 TaxID=1210091 RepID=A0A511MVC1_9NOCA|nr:DUF4386 domain-containing protein [Nocardia ninae]GEM44046.1 hypothetical protein NN4_85650 [Nocardia ninae NBRC 108245]
MSTLESTKTVAADQFRRLQLRVAGIVALTGVVLIVFVNSLLGEVPRTEYLAVLDHVNERPWFVMRLAGILAMLAWVVAFSTVGRTLRDPIGRVIARMGEPVLIVAVAVFAVDYAHDGFSIGVTAERWAAGELAANDAVADARVLEVLVGATSMLSQALLGLGLTIYAAALLLTREFSRILCWLGIIGAAGWFLGGAALIARVDGLRFEVVLPFVGAATIWVTGIGITLIRRSFRTDQ